MSEDLHDPHSGTPKPPHPSYDSYRMLVEREWADLHHSRVQEWTALGVVTAAHVGILQLLTLTRNAALSMPFSTLVLLGGLLAGVFAVLGLLVTMRHRCLMAKKLGWIWTAEELLGLIKTPDNPRGVVPTEAKMKPPIQWKELGIPRFLSTSWLIACFYLLFLTLDVLGVVLAQVA